MIGGFKLDGKRVQPLLVGYFEKGKLLFAGKVYGVFNSAALLKILTALRAEKCAFVNLPTNRSDHWGEGVTAEEMGDYTWVKPAVVAEIKFAEWTACDVLRHAEFQGLREDKSAREIGREISPKQRFNPKDKPA